MTFQDFPWTKSDEVRMAEPNYLACAYNAAVNSDVPRGVRKMGDLIRAINYYERIVGRAMLDFLVERGVIESYMPCSTECQVRPGGLFHAQGCENDMNHPVSRARCKAADEQLPRHLAYAAHPLLVGGR